HCALLLTASPPHATSPLSFHGDYANLNIKTVANLYSNSSIHMSIITPRWVEGIANFFEQVLVFFFTFLPFVSFFFFSFFFCSLSSSLLISICKAKLVI